MSVVLAPLCLTAALLLAPPSAAVRRRAVLSRRPSTPSRRRGRKWWIPLALMGAAGLLPLGVGAALAGAVVALTTWRRAGRTRIDRLRDVESARLVDGLDAVIAELRVGAHPSTAAQEAARESQGVAAQAFALAAARSRLSGSGADGVRIPGAVVAAELDRVADAWRMAECHGLALAELLGAARVDLAGRIRFRTRTVAALAGPRATATVLAGLPLLGIGLGQLMGADPLAVLFGPGAGTILLPLGTGLACVGLLWTDAITSRVLR